MGEKLVVGIPFQKGLKTSLPPFMIDNDSFPTLINACQFRGRVKRKRGTQFLSQLTRNIPSGSIGNSQASPWSINTIYSTYTPAITPEANALVVLGSVTITIASTPNIIFTDNSDGTLSAIFKGLITNATQAVLCQITSAGHGLSTGDIITINGVNGMTQLNGNTYTITVIDPNNFTLNGVNSIAYGAYISNGFWTSITLANTGTINYVTGVITLTHTAGAGVATTSYFSYTPGLPGLGAEDLSLPIFQYTQTIGFDTTYSYHFLSASPFSNFDVSYYQNPSSSVFLPGYIPKTTWDKTTWNGQNYQLFSSCNYQGALWVTNGVKVPFPSTLSGIGMQFKHITNMNITAATPLLGPSIVTLTIAGHGLVQGDFIFVNEVNYVVPNTANSINFQTGYVINVINANQVSVEFPNAYLLGVYSSGGIAQYLTNRANPSVDCLRWFNGDPTSLTTNPVFLNDAGWVNFMPPLSNGIYSIANLPADQYYLVGAKTLLPFKDRLLFFGPVIQTSSGNPIYLGDTIIWSQNGTPYYTCSFTKDPTLTTTVFNPILVPNNETATASAWWEDFTGYGGFLPAGISQNINTVDSNEDALIIGFPTYQTRLFYSGNDLLPFSLFVINSELGSSSTFSAITMDQGVLSRGDRGFVITSQTQSQRFDLDIPDQVFETNLFNNGTERICAARDYINEWVYFSYPSVIDEVSPSNINFTFPNQTLLYNYRDQSWGIFDENYTCYGNFKRQSGFIWATVGNTYPTWADWNDPWDAGASTSLQPFVIAGNQQGFFCIKGVGTGEGVSLFITAISGQVLTSPSHGLNVGDFIIVSGALGVTGLNGVIAKVLKITLTEITIDVTTTGTYIGGGKITRIYNPFIQTKQFPLGWQDMRKTRLGVQQYLLSYTPNSQITLQIFLSQDSANAYNDPNQVTNSSLIYSTVLYTCPESSNLGLTPYTTNLQMPTALTQQQIWHRINTSLIGDTVQLGFTMSEAQIRAVDSNNKPLNAFSEIELHGFIIDVSPSYLLA